jgi:hypothetical protein
MSTIQNPPPDLLSLPNELLAKICVYAVDEEPSMRGKDWLRAVRLTCKLLYTPATKELAKRFFTSPDVMMSRHSLQRLVALCKHDLIGPYVREIVFYPYRLDNESFGRIQTKMSSLIITADQEGIAEAKRHVECYFARVQEDIVLKTSGDAKMLFKEAFGALRKYQNRIKLVATTKTTTESVKVFSGHTEWRSYRPRIGEFLSFSKIAFVDGGGTTSILPIFEAAYAAGSQIHAFKLRLDTMEDNVPVHLSLHSIQALSRLQMLEIDIDGLHTTRTINRTLIKVISIATRLAIVAFSSGSVHTKRFWTLASYMSDMTRALDSHALRQMWLRKTVVECESLLMMLRKHSSTLKELTIYNVFLLGYWHEILPCIRDELHLDKLVLINLATIDKFKFRGDFENAEVDYVLDGSVELYGHEKVTSGIDEVLFRWNREKVDPDYDLSWGNADDVGHLAYPED